MSTPQNVRLPGITCGRLQITAVRYGDGAMLITRQTAPEWMIGAATGPWHRKADGRFEAERTVICASRVQFVKRLSGFPGLRDWLLAAGIHRGEDATVFYEGCHGQGRTLGRDVPR